MYICKMNFSYSFFNQQLGRIEDLPESEAAKMVANKIQMEKPHNRGWYRIAATRGFTGGRKLVPKVLNTFEEVSFNLIFIQLFII